MFLHVTAFLALLNEFCFWVQSGGLSVKGGGRGISTCLGKQSFLQGEGGGV